MARWTALLCAAALALALVGTRVAAQASSANETIVEYLAADERFTVLLELLSETGLLQELNSTDAKFTFFAPTNDAIFASFNGNKTHAHNLTEILKYHIVPGEFSRVNFTEVAPPGNGLVVVPPVVVPSFRPTSSPTPTPSSSTCICTCPAPSAAPQARRSTDSSGSAASGSGSGSDADYVEDATTNPTNLTSFALKTLLTLDSLDGQAQRIKALGTAELSVELANNVTVTEPDIQVRNGFIQIIDGVLEPPGNVTVVVADLARNFSLWVALIERINATDLFTEANSTVLLPIELSFPASTKNCSNVACTDAELEEEQDEMDDNMDRVQALIGTYNDSEWRDILELMVIPNAVLYTDDLAAMLNVTSGNATMANSTSTTNNSSNATEPSLDFTTAADVSLNISIAESGDAYNLTTADGQSAAIVRDARLFDVPTGTGVVHVISRILFPADLAPQKPAPSALQALLIANNATLFATALNSTNVAAQISGGNYTLFAPTDAAFVSFNNSQGATLTEIIDVHIVPGEPAVVNGAELKPLDANATLLINHDQAAFTVRVLEVPQSFANILSNVTTAAYHVFFIDHVLEPPK